MGQSIFVIDVKEGEFYYAGFNPTCERVTGISTIAAQGKTPQQIHNPQFAQIVRQHYQECLTLGDSITYEEYLPFQGQEMWWLTTLTPIRDQQSQIYRIVGTSLNVTPQQKIEAALQQSQTKLNDILNSVGAAIASFRLFANYDWEYEYCSAGSQVIFGYELQEARLDKYSWMSRVHVDDRVAILMPLFQDFFAERTVTVEYRFHHPSGALIWISGTYASRRDWAADCWVVTVVSHDITDRKHIEAALQRSEEQRRLALEFAHIGSWDWHIATNTTVWNETHFHLLGLVPSQERVSQQLWRDRVHPDDLAHIEQAKDEALSTQTDYSQEYRVVHPDGSIRWMLGKGRAVPNAEGRPVRMLGVIMDITDRKQSEQALRDSEEQLQLVLDANHDGIWDWNLLTNQVFRSRQWYEIIGYTPNDFTIDYEEWIDRIHPDDVEMVLIAQQAYLKRRSPDYIVELRMRCKDGSYKWCESRGTAQWDGQGRPFRMVGSLRDITARKQRSAELQRAKESAEAANLAKSTFLSNVNHELRTPLAIILGCSELMRYDKSLSSKQRERLGTIERSVQHLMDLINNVLELSKIEVGAAKLHLGIVNLPDLFQSLEDMFQMQARSKKIQLGIDRSSSLPQLVQTDESKLRQILINLLSNAVKFTEVGSVQLKAWGSTHQTLVESSPLTSSVSHRLHFEVADTGLGIAPGEIDQIFEAFVQAESGRKSKKGTGLGLTITRQFVQLMGGQITVRSVLGEGTLFSVELPTQFDQSQSTVSLPTLSLDRLNTPQPDQTLKARLSMMSDTWISSLHQAAARLNADRCLRLIEQIPAEHQSLALALRDWVNRFQFDRVLSLTRDPK
ncbi:MAG: PAS domain-containing protein [Leptolyngbyaceae cyanobacterium CSU_1_3]|nr:PAS domain-containing protein [Leptolyngbyaceae cyanobacterium CSU_1_3]